MHATIAHLQNSMKIIALKIAWERNNISIELVLRCWRGLEISGRFYQPGLTLIPAWMNNYIHYKMRDEITYSFLNLNGCTVEV